MTIQDKVKKAQNTQELQTIVYAQAEKGSYEPHHVSKDKGGVKAELRIPGTSVGSPMQRAQALCKLLGDEYSLKCLLSGIDTIWRNTTTGQRAMEQRLNGGARESTQQVELALYRLGIATADVDALLAVYAADTTLRLAKDAMTPHAAEQ